MVLSIHEEEDPVDSEVGTTAVTMDAAAGRLDSCLLKESSC